MSGATPKPKRPKFRKVVFTIAAMDAADRVKVTGYVDPELSELAIHKHGPEPWQTWRLSHVASGLLLADRDKRREIKEVLGRVKAAMATNRVPWDSSAEEIDAFLYMNTDTRLALLNICRRPTRRVGTQEKAIEGTRERCT